MGVATLSRMFDDRVGAILRAVRIRRGLRQVDVARLASVSAMTVSRMERGHFEALAFRAIRGVARALEVRMDLSPWSRHGDLHRFATAEHAALVETVIRALVVLGWQARAEVSFSQAGERGFIDILAWHPFARILLVVEVKTEIVDIGETLGTLDRKRRLAPAIARELRWIPGSVHGLARAGGAAGLAGAAGGGGLAGVASIATALVVEDTRTNRRRIADHRATIQTQLPDDGRRFRAFLRHPAGTVAAVAFWSNKHPGVARQQRPGARRVRRANSCSARRL